MASFRNGYSHITIPVGLEQLYPLVLEFYEKIGFFVESKRLNKLDSWLYFALDFQDSLSHISSSTTSEQNEYIPRKDTLEEVWLKEERRNRSPLPDPRAIIRLIYFKEAPVKSYEEARDKAIKISMEDVSGYPLCCIICADCSELEQRLKALKWPYLIKECNPPLLINKNYSVTPDRKMKDHPNCPASVMIHTCDPAGNWISFTNRTSPFDSITFPCSRQSSLKTSETSALSPSENLKKKRICVLTSGGDSSGMNSSVRAVVRAAIQKGLEPYISYRGYKGLVDNQNSVVKACWDDVRALQSVGGTSIGTERCKEFLTREGRLAAAKSLVERNISCLVVIGGDGSLTGANILKNEWNGLVEELINTGKVERDKISDNIYNFQVVGIVGSIDNDMVNTDFTIGAYTSLHRICESLDSILSTALSHKRAFVVEVMGRKCGWLGLMTTVAIGAHYMFIPEMPPPFNKKKYGNNWKAELCDVLDRCRKSNNYRTLVIVSEGAIDCDLKPITSEEIANVIINTLCVSTRYTCLGHVQRGGNACGYDRYLGTVQGVKAVEILSKPSSGSLATMIAVKNNKMTEVDLIGSVNATKELANAIDRKDFQRAFEMRGEKFRNVFECFLKTSFGNIFMEQIDYISDKSLSPRIGIVTVGAPAGGINSAVRCVSRILLNMGCTPIGFASGIYGLSKDWFKFIEWSTTVGMQVEGGSALGSSRVHPRPLYDSPRVYPKVNDYAECGMIAYNLQKHQIGALILIGGFEALTSQLILTDARRIYPAFKIPIITIPATVSNNVPGTEYSIGCDTALDVVVEACDRIKISADATRERIYVTEVQGGKCGYLASVGGLTSGSSYSYIPEEGITLERLCNDFKSMYKCCNRGSFDRPAPSIGRIMLISDGTSDVYNSVFISSTFKEFMKHEFDIKSIVLGHLQQGGVPSPFDRINATQMSNYAINHIFSCLSKVNSTSFDGPQISEFSDVVGTDNSTCYHNNIYTVIETADLKNRRPRHSWFLEYHSYIELLNKYHYDDDENIRTSE